MKKLLTTLPLLLSLLPAAANFDGAGYYRLKNVYTQRYITVVDDECEYVDLVTGKIDGHSLVTQKSFSLICHDPASVIYAKQVSGSNYEVSAQGISLKNMMNYNLHLGEWKKEGTEILYRLYATDKGVTKYLADKAMNGADKANVQFGTPTASSPATQRIVSWYIDEISADSDDNYFGVLPTVSTSSGNWASLYASFPYSAASQGVEFYYPCAVASTGIVEMKKIEGAVAGGVPVIVKCSATEPSGNRLNVGVANGAKPTDNKQKGQYFNFDDGQYVHRLAYDKQTMRVLGRCSDGSIGFVTDETLDYIPANTTYIRVAAWYPKELKCVFSHAEFNAGVGEIIADEEEVAAPDVYSITGALLYRQATPEQISALPGGVYIIGGKKRMVK